MGPIYHRTSPSHRSSVHVSASANADARPQFGKGAEKRVVITGMGVVSSLGHDPDELYDNLLAGKSGISLIEGFDTSKMQPRIFLFSPSLLLFSSFFEYRFVLKFDLFFA